MTDEGELLRDQLAQTIFDANEQSTSRVMDRRNVMAWDDAPDLYKGVLMDIADALLSRFDVRLRVPANEELRWDGTKEGERYEYRPAGE